ncbi:MAG: glucosidase [Anaerolineae bacterium]|jgi:hypothetical protein|nr:glucosidase [Anaerolineae bacterium]
MSNKVRSINEEFARLDEARRENVPWRKWGPYLSERQWGTVREDYSDNGNAWDYLTHDQARSRAYRWGEDGLAGISDDKQLLCLALALWNGQDPILKERLFGLANSEANHGEDVKEYYYYLDSTPTHSYMKYLYKYPQAAFPYEELTRVNRARTRNEMEYELLDTGVFDENRYFDVFVEFAKGSPEDALIRITVRNHGPERATLRVLPTVWFRNTWSWGRGALEKPVLRQVEPSAGGPVVHARHPTLGDRYFYCDRDVPVLFTENETNNERIFGSPNASPYVKDAFDAYVVHGKTDAVNPERVGTKAAALYVLEIPAGGSESFNLRLTDISPEIMQKAAGKKDGAFGSRFDSVMLARQKEADTFYGSITPDAIEGKDAGNIMRQALGGLLWTKQYYLFDLEAWLEEHHAHPLHGSARKMRNANWFHMLNDDVLSMPDKWEYPWYAAWDLAFHTTALAMVDVDFAKHQLDLMLQHDYLHPSGQIPAYEWNFSDVNPPVHAWATSYVYETERQLRGAGDVEWLKSSFSKLLLNFTWWVNRKDPGDRNVFEGGFLGLDNIGVFDRSSPLPTGGHLEQADGTGWMAFYSQCMLQIAIELAEHDPAYEDMALKFLQHFLRIAGAMDRPGEWEDEMWDEQDGFFYDLLRLPDGKAVRLKVRSMVGLLPLAASTVFPHATVERFPRLVGEARTYVARRSELLTNITPVVQNASTGMHLLSTLNEAKLRRVLARMLDEDEFLSEYGIRSLSKAHQDNPYILRVGENEYRVSYLPAESDNGMFGGNSNWRGPIWIPVNILLVRSLLNLYSYYGDEFRVECPTGSGRMMNLQEVARFVSLRLARIFLLDGEGRRPVWGGAEKFQTDPHWRDYILFYEYFHGDNGAGLGASHQTGWTALIARLIQFFAAAEGVDAALSLRDNFYVERSDGAQP